MPTVKLTATSRRGKYGVVSVKKANGPLDRQYKITEQQLAAWQQAGRWGAATHIGVTQEEWESGRAVLVGKDYEVGDARRRAGGGVRLKYAERVVAGRFVESYLDLSPGEWSGTFPDITVSKQVLDSAVARPRLFNVSPPLPLVGLVAGVLEII